ncbi:hypothetical protein ASD38_13745 [Caulobacter sp. Root487D2Y]|uniref:hypothetical protein n=1 Tax=unclassified Caulobacter TaxID=2648921 RepID=UPI0006FC958E|nr:MULTISPECIES: hypothetical protein [unclassified Caulobacter]KQY28717.1 hypothetical protein ASD38_13745 [Caulobacter sp. Root487D2Y]
MKLGWIAVLAALSLPLGALAEDRCGGGRITSGAAEMFVTVRQFGAAPPQVTYVHLDVASADKTFAAGTHYEPVGDVLGSPVGLFFTAYMPLPDPKAAVRENIAWSFDGGPWTVSEYSGEPQRDWGDPAKIRGSVDHRIARGPRYPIHPDRLTALPAGVNIALKRLDLDGHELGSGTLRYPPQAMVDALFASTRRAALADLKPCGPPVIISNVPPPRG